MGGGASPRRTRPDRHVSRSPRAKPSSDVLLLPLLFKQRLANLFLPQRPAKQRLTRVFNHILSPSRHENDRENCFFHFRGFAHQTAGAHFRYSQVRFILVGRRRALLISVKGLSISLKLIGETIDISNDHRLMLDTKDIFKLDIINPSADCFM